MEIKDNNKRRVEAEELATKFAAHPAQRANPFAYARAYNAVLTGWLKREDFTSTDFRVGDLS